MKKLLLSLFTFTLMLPLMANDLDQLTGSYTGNLDVSMLAPGTEETILPQVQNVKVYTEKKAGENTLTLFLKDFFIIGIPVGDIEVPNVTVDENGIISAPEVILDKNAEGLGMLPTTLNGTLTPESADLDIRVIWNEDVNIKVKYVGTKDIADSIDKINTGSLSTVIINNTLSVPNAQILSYSIYNMNGTLIDSRNESVKSVDLSQYTAGISIIQIHTESGSLTRKISCK
ncbi:MAG: calycin-like domain-containing protein [Bacteroidales bacterium]